MGYIASRTDGGLVLPPIRTVLMEPEPSVRNDHSSHSERATRSNRCRHHHNPYRLQGQLHGIQVAGPSMVRDKNAWKSHARCVMRGGVQEYRCVWKVGCVGTDKDQCGYTAKRHLVKRHIETRHLLYK